jgi:hypothetical protein
MRVGFAHEVAGHFHRLWSARSPLWRVLLFDMLLWGTVLNLCAAGISLTLIAFDAPAWAATAVFLLPMPYNLLLCTAVWRACDRQSGPLATGARAVAIVWVAAVTVL